MKIILKVTSVLQIIGGLLRILLSVVAFMGSGFLGTASSSASGLTQTAGVMTTSLVLILGVILLAGGTFSLVCGIFGLKGAKGDAGKLKKALVLGWISLVLSVITILFDINVGTDIQEVLKSLLSLVVPVLFVVSAASVKKEL